MRDKKDMTFAELVRDFDTTLAVAKKVHKQNPARHILHAAEKRVNTGGGYPFYSENLGVEADQQPELVEKLRATGDPRLQSPEFKDGKIRIESPGHRNALLKQAGLFDKDAGYGDYAGS